MAPSDLRRPYKRMQLSEQQRRRELSLKRQEQSRDAELHARLLASTLLSLPPEQQPSESELGSSSDYDLRDASKLKGLEVRKWFSKQLMLPLPEWMIDVPHRLPHDWYVLPRPSGKRGFVVSSDGTTINRQRNGTILHRFPSALPHGSRNRDGSGPPSYSILDCIFHEVVLELQDDGKVTTSDDPPVAFSCLNLEFIRQSGLESGCLLRFAIGDGGLTIVDGKLERADLHYLGKLN